ncbi:ankyrin repeat domain-containing protein [Asaia prunellae]|uniref:ankyrin repeat domain-containing protein n=1 Tax=Asaia prunellae TaxID=610245 RepID=UPI001FB12D87|nr:ankyrin repeat domain-containing protein [Asaia prunellae]
MLTAALAASPVFFIPWHAAHAQSADDAEAEQEAEEAQKKAEARRAAKAAAPPSALPGADSQEQDAGHANVDLNPTEALFDAINRGSLNAAKEALNRGADMNAKNVLFQTPLDMAIDLNRKDIMFLLLSMRNYGDSSFAAETTHSAIETDSKGNGHLTIKGKGRKNASAMAVAAKGRQEASGGQPQPAIGFLGFGGR